MIRSKRQKYAHLAKKAVNHVCNRCGEGKLRWSNANQADRQALPKWILVSTVKRDAQGFCLPHKCKVGA
jgi:hypothetical protein